MFEESTSASSCGVAKTSTVVLQFDGSKETFEDWWEKAKLALVISEMDDLLVKDIDSKLPEKESEAIGAAQKKLVKQNKLEMAKL